MYKRSSRARRLFNISTSTSVQPSLINSKLVSDSGHSFKVEGPKVILWPLTSKSVILGGKCFKLRQSSLSLRLDEASAAEGAADLVFTVLGFAAKNAIEFLTDCGTSDFPDMFGINEVASGANEEV